MTNTPLTGRPIGLQRKQFAASYLGISSRTLDRLVAEGKLSCVRPTPGSVRFTIEALDEYISSLTAAAK